MPATSLSLRRRAVWAPLLVPLLLLAAACGGGSSAAESTPSPPAPGFPAAGGGFADLDLDSLSACMTDAGFDFDFDAGSDPGPLFGNEDAAATDQLRVCAEEQGATLPEGGFPGGNFPEGGPPGNFDGAGGQELLDCLREAGIEVDESAGEGAPGPFGGFDRSDPDVQAALQACGLPGGNGP